MSSSSTRGQAARQLQTHTYLHLDELPLVHARSEWCPCPALFALPAPPMVPPGLESSVHESASQLDTKRRELDRPLGAPRVSRVRCGASPSTCVVL